MALTDKLKALIASKLAIKTAIESKGVTVGDSPFSEYGGKIGEISGSGEYLTAKQMSEKCWTIFYEKIAHYASVNNITDTRQIYGTMLLLKAHPFYKSIGIDNYGYPYRFMFKSMYKSDGEILPRPTVPPSIIDFKNDYDITYNSEKCWWIIFLDHTETNGDRIMQTQTSMGRHTLGVLAYNHASENCRGRSTIKFFCFNDIKCMTGMDGLFTLGYMPSAYFMLREFNGEYIDNIDFAQFGNTTYSGAGLFDRICDIGRVKLQAFDYTISTDNVNITIEGMLNIIEGLPKLDSGVTKTIKSIPWHVFDNISMENIIVASNKGWTLTRATY